MSPARRKNLEVLIAGEVAGNLSLSKEGELSFSYASNYAGPDLSIAMPFSDTPYGGKRVIAWFDNLLPDNIDVRRGMAAQAGTSTGIFPLLSHYGLDLPGAVQVVSPDESSLLGARNGGYIRLTPTEVGKRLRKIAESESLNRARSWTRSEEHWSLGGMQTKLALRLFEGEWYECGGDGASNVIVKPGASGLENQALIEYATMRLAALCGLPTAPVSMASFDGVESIVVGRYDRHTSPDNGYVTRIHQEDLCQATSTMSSKKYAADGGPSATYLMALLKDTEGNGARRFTDALLFNYLTASTDAHAKNYSLLHPGRSRALLAPLYDVASAAPFLKRGRPYHLAMSIGGENRVGWLRKSSIEKFAKMQHLDPVALTRRTEELAHLIMENLDGALADLPPRKGINETASLLRTRIVALCKATERNIQVDSDRFKPIDITRLRA